jgi:hypothetical protein
MWSAKQQKCLLSEPKIKGFTAAPIAKISDVVSKPFMIKPLYE